MNFNDNQLLSQQELLELNMRKQEALKLSTGRRRNYIDNEFANGGITGLFSLFFSKSAFKHGWEKEENIHRAANNQIEVTADPTNKIYAFAIATTALIMAAFGGVVGAVGGGAVFAAVGVAAGAAVGGVLGVLEGFFESGKVRREINEGKSSVKKAVHEIKQDGRQRQAEAKNEELAKKLELLEQRLAEQSNGKESVVQKHLERNEEAIDKTFSDRAMEQKQLSEAQERMH